MKEGSGLAQLRDRLYECVVLWEEYMAESAVTALAAEPRQWAGAGPRHAVQPRAGRLVVLAGSSHVAGRLGLPDRIAKRLAKANPGGPGSSSSSAGVFTVVPQSVAWRGPQRPQLDALPSTEDADWVWYTQLDSIA